MSEEINCYTLAPAPVATKSGTLDAREIPVEPVCDDAEERCELCRKRGPCDPSRQTLRLHLGHEKDAHTCSNTRLEVCAHRQGTANSDAVWMQHVFLRCQHDMHVQMGYSSTGACDARANNP